MYYHDFCSIFSRACGATISRQFFFRACGADAFTIVMLPFFCDTARIVAALYYSDFGSIFCRACGAVRIFKAICAAAYTFVILALF